MIVARLTSIRLLLGGLIGLISVNATGDAVGQGAWGNSSYNTTSNYSWDGGWNSGDWLGSSGVDRGWKLGVTGDNSDAGVVVRRVEPNSAAARANISPGDSIVCVAGDQVGRVGGKIFDLSEEIDHHADSRGQVLMLINYRRRGQLRAVNMQLQDQRAGLSGSIAINGGRLPSDAVVTVRLENLSRPYYVVRNGEYSFRLANFGVGDIPFELNYDPQYISATDNYRVRAFVTSSGRTIYDTIRPPLVLTNGNPNNVRLTLNPTSYSPANSGQVVNVGYTPIDVHAQDITAAYQRYLGRAPTSMEMAAWHHTPDLSLRAQRLPLELMATQEYFNRAGGNNTLWLQRAFIEIVGHAPTSTETDLWMRRFAELRYSRSVLLSQLDMQARG